jgi:hypothetical protein
MPQITNDIAYVAFSVAAAVIVTVKMWKPLVPTINKNIIRRSAHEEYVGI